MIDTDKYEGHTEGPWSIRSPVSQVTKKYRDGNEGKIGFPMSDWPSYGVAGVGPCSIRRYMNDRKSEETWHANIHLVADAPLLLAEVKRLREALAYTASLLTCRTEGDDIPLIHIREYALDVVDMTVDEAMATTDLMGDEEE